MDMTGTNEPVVRNATSKKVIETLRQLMGIYQELAKHMLEKRPSEIIERLTKLSVIDLVFNPKGQVKIIVYCSTKIRSNGTKSKQSTTYLLSNLFEYGLLNKWLDDRYVDRVQVLNNLDNSFKHILGDIRVLGMSQKVYDNSIGTDLFAPGAIIESMTLTRLGSEDNEELEFKYNGALDEYKKKIAMDSCRDKEITTLRQELTKAREEFSKPSGEATIKYLQQDNESLKTQVRKLTRENKKLSYIVNKGGKR